MMLPVRFLRPAYMLLTDIGCIDGQFIRENMLKPTRVIKSLTDLTLITS